MLAALLLALATPQQIIIERAHEWDALFDRTSGWTGADGIYAIPMSGEDRIGAGQRTATMFVFSDTFIGEVNAQGRRLGGSTLVNNTMALLEAGAGADPDRIQFFWRRVNQSPAAVFEPSTPNTKSGEFYWLKDGIRIDGETYIFAGRFSKVPPPFHREGIALITIPAGEKPPFHGHTQVDAPLFLDENAQRGQVSFGGAIMENTIEAGAITPDGFIYVYGVQEDPFNKQVVVARVPRASFTDFGQYRFWDGSAWVGDIHQARPMTGRVSGEMSVSPIPDGRYVMVFQLDTITRKTAICMGDSPVGPWSEAQVIYRAPVPSDPPGIFTYNAKAHPHLSAPNTLLISYNVNTIGNFADHFTYADIYRPRFIRIRFP